MPINILRQLPKQHPKQRRQQRTRQIQPLRPKVIPIVQLPPLKRSEEKTVNHVPEEEGLFGVLTRGHRDVGEHLFLEDLLGVVDASFAGEGGDGTATTDEVECDLVVMVSSSQSLSSARAGEASQGSKFGVEGRREERGRGKLASSASSRRRARTKEERGNSRHGSESETRPQDTASSSRTTRNRSGRNRCGRGCLCRG
jgi:hypothetical protein